MYERLTHQEQIQSRGNINIDQKVSSSNKKNTASMSNILETVMRLRRNPNSLTGQDIILLQHSIGNQATQKLLSEINAPDPVNNGSTEKSVSNTNTYIVKSGDTLSFIANKYNTTVDELVRLNNIKDRNKIYPGQVIILPQNTGSLKPTDNKNESKSEAKGDAAKATSNENTYIVKPGDTLSFIANKYNTTVDELVKLNNIKDRNKIYPGQVINLPKKSDKTVPKDSKNESTSKNTKGDESPAKSGNNKSSESGGDKNLVSIAEEVIFGNEGSYGTVVKDDNGALSIGKIQWHGTRARDLLIKIRDKNPSLAKSTLPKSIYDNLDSGDNYWKTRTLTDSEATAISNLLKTTEGKAAQDEQSKTDVGGYISAGKRLGITDNQTLVYFADLYNQSPDRAIEIVKAAGGGNGLTLDKIHEAALANSVMGNYKSRRNKTYNSCKKIGSSKDNNTDAVNDKKTSTNNDNTNNKNTKGIDNTKKDKSEDTAPYADMTKTQKEEVVFGKDRKYYTTESEASKNMVTITVKVWDYDNKGSLYTRNASLTINKNLKNDVQAIFNEIYESGEKFPIKSVGGYNFRKMAAGSSLSHHSYGTAIDINPNENYMIKDNKIISGKLYEPGKNKYSMPADGIVVMTFKKHGWIWGGDWKSSKDYMHFSFLGN